MAGFQRISVAPLNGHAHPRPGGDGLEYFPAALAAFEDLDAPEALELLAKAPDPASGRFAVEPSLGELEQFIAEVRRRPPR
jgi:hypothetical protein